MRTDPAHCKRLHPWGLAIRLAGVQTTLLPFSIVSFNVVRTATTVSKMEVQSHFDDSLVTQRFCVGRALSFRSALLFLIVCPK